MLAIVAIYALLASTFVIAKLALAYAHPLLLIGVRMSLAGAIMSAWVAWRGYRNYRSQVTGDQGLGHPLQGLRIATHDLLYFFKIAFFHIYLAFTCEFWALQSLSSAKTNLIYTATPFIAATLSYLILHERLSWRKSLSLLLGLLGLLPVTLTQESSCDKEASSFLPELVLLVAVTSASYAWFDIKRMMQRGYCLLWINGFAMFVGGVASLITAWLVCDDSAFKVDEPVQLIKYTLLMILVSNFIFYNAYGWLIDRYSITFLTFAGFLSPIFGALYGKLLLKEPLHWGYGGSLALITLALYIFYQEELRLGISTHSKEVSGPSSTPPEIS